MNFLLGWPIFRGELLVSFMVRDAPFDTVCVFFGAPRLSLGLPQTWISGHDKVTQLIHRDFWWRDDERFFSNIILKTLWKNCEEDNIWIWEKKQHVWIDTCFTPEMHLKSHPFSPIPWLPLINFSMLCSPNNTTESHSNGRFAAPHRSAITLWRSKRPRKDFRENREVWCVSQRY